MTRSAVTRLGCSLLLLALVSSVSAHYLWVTVAVKPGKHGTTNIYFEGGPAAGNGQYLDPFIKEGKTWIRTLEAPKPKLIKIQDMRSKGKRWLSAALPAKGPRSIDSYGKWGVYRYGKTDVLLHYYARNLDVSDHEHLHELGRAEQMNLDLVPHDNEKGIQVKVLWRNKPSTGTLVFVVGPKGFKKNLKTNKDGTITFQPKAEGRYTLRTLVTEKNKKGTDKGKPYTEVRHHATMTIKLPL